MKEGNRIRTIRQQQHLSAEKLAALTKIPSQTIFRYELRPIEKVPVGALECIATALGVSKDILLQQPDRLSNSVIEEYPRPFETVIPVTMTVPVSANIIYNWLEACHDPGTLRYLGRAALRFAEELESPNKNSRLEA